MMGGSGGLQSLKAAAIAGQQRFTVLPRPIAVQNLWNGTLNASDGLASAALVLEDSGLDDRLPFMGLTDGAVACRTD